MSESLPFTTADFFVLRTPSLPFDFQETWSRGGPSQGAQDDGALRASLKEAVQRADIREALFVASRDLEAALDPWLRGELSPERERRLELSLVRYLTRMSSRPTPFGLFAGCSVGSWGEVSRLAVPAWTQCRRRTRLDMDYVAALVETLEREPAVRATQEYRPNTSLYQAAGRWRYAESRVEAGKGRDYHLVALEDTGFLESVLTRASGGASLASLALALAREAGCELAEAEAFLDQLVEAQVLTSSLPPAITGGEQLEGMVQRLLTQEATLSLGAPLAEVQADLRLLDGAGSPNPPERYQAVARKLSAFSAKIDPQHLFQVDQHKPAPGLTLGPAVRKALEEAAALLRRLSAPRAPGPLERFKEAFRERYETRWVPLLEALDGEAGLDFGPRHSPGQAGIPLLENLAFPSPEPARDKVFTSRDAYLLKRLQALDGAQTWILDDGDLAALENPQALPMPDSFAAVASLAAASPEALAQGTFQVLMEHTLGPSGARLLGRFCQGDPELEARVRTHLAAEEACRPWALFAEVVHQPDGRTGNILSRPALRTYEIPFLGVSGVPEPFQILPRDLLVTVVGNRVALRSARLGREVLPRLTSAHNYSQGLPVYRFLALLQDQEGGSFGWTWGCLGDLPFLPRVSRGRHVLTRARWRVEASELDAPPTFAGFQALRQKRRLPRFVVLEEGDNALWVDLDQPLRVETLLHLVTRQPFFILREAFPGPDDLVAAGPEGSFCHELVVPFEALPAARTAPAPLPELSCAPRSFPPGSRWLYAKIYTGEATADHILLETLAPFLERSRGLWERWFFIRYGDPSPHLRIRFQGDPEFLTRTLLPRLMATLEPLLENGLCWKLQLDTYEQERERYGGLDGLALAEAWFCLDSERALALLPRAAGDEGAQQRWQWALKGVDRLLDDLGLDLPAKTRIVARTREGLGREFQAQGLLSLQLGTSFRTLRKDLEALLAGGESPEEELAWQQHSRAQRSCLARLRRASREGRLSLPLEDLASSLAHMHVNRLLRSSQRAQEFVIMDFLNRLYTSQAKRRVGAPGLFP